MKRIQRQNRSSRGFTLIEMMLVALIMGVMASTAALSGGDSGEYRVNMVETQVRDAVDYAQALARSTRASVGVVFDVSSERLAVVGETGQPVMDQLTKADYIVDFKAPNQPRNVDIQTASFGAAGHVVLFDPQGIPLTGGSVSIRCHQATRVLVLDAATGVMARS
jgi:type II secretion system protein H